MKSLLALLIACLLALLPAGVLGWRVADGIREHFGAAFVRNFTALNREKILAPLSRELALSQRLADSAVLQQWLRHEAGESERAAATRELHSFRRGFRDHVLFVASAISGHYFFESGTAAQEPRAAYTLSRNESKDSWFYTSLASNVPYNINVNYDRQLKTTKVWLNVLIRDGEALGIAGTGLDLSGFLREFISRGEAGVTPLIVDDHGAIQAHPDESLIVLNAGAGLANSNRTVFDLLDDPASRNAMRTAMQHARAQPGLVASDWVAQGGVRKLLAVSYISELNWHVITLLDLDASSVVDAHWLWLALLAVALLIGALLLGFAVAIERMVLKPLRHLQASASAIAGGNYALDLPVRRDDEIGELSQAFGTMASKVQRHTQELESKVRERTAALLDANQRIVAAHQQLDDSIRYASLIQRAILPDRDMVRSLGAQHFVLWRPRDVVGGDFYIFRADGPNCLIGVADCAGHGVP
ncbi:HAMP domain-containing protein, partial [Chitinimonas sp.]|uniref:HAMP domain-containing protein n=1 Tax=Chitinimonas sp. TaxID=1934313 RepID=UPI0035AFE015